MRPTTFATQLAFAAAIGSTGAAPASAASISAAAQRAPIATGALHKVYGNVQSLRGNALIVRLRTGRLLRVDGSAAHSSVFFTRDRPVIVYGTTDASGVMHATAVWRTFPDAAHWPADR